jgi:hypothetical protein
LPIFDELGKRFRSINSVVVGKIDYTKNQIDHARIEKLPTVLFYPAEVSLDENDVGDSRKLFARNQIGAPSADNNELKDLYMIIVSYEYYIEI